MSSNFLNKWVAATVPLVLFFLLFGYWNPHDILIMLMWAAPISYTYGILSSYLIDGLAWKWKITNKWLIGVLYVLAGALFFIPFFQLVIRIQEMGAILGFMGIGAGMALSFYLCSLVFRHRKVNLYVAVLGPLFLLVLMQIYVFQWEMDKKDGWVENQTKQYVEASFDYFHGEHPIPIRLEAGQRLTFNLKWKYWQEGSIGHYVQPPEGQRVGMEELGDQSFRFEAQEDGVYHIFLTGRKVKHGQFAVYWSID
ncbi:hypothetical protein [Ammoniphilus sp. YIM 78166]|uniref:hypothetical protein n=1 Tax=Ammoniphilus sp. YIM 78166 TaxID=1644106 RepID=UPI00106F6249|nr:hypothetical protein [Ammoniphilus sp. YIM 78166]